jgi:chemotaxis protein histidine kinase CheA
MNDSDDIVKEFLVRSYENLDRLDRDLITLEKNRNDRDVLGSIFRTTHTIKDTSGFLAFDKLGAVAHVGENLLGQLRDGELQLNLEVTTARGYYRECTAIPHVPPPSPLIHTSWVTVETAISNRLRNSM